MSAPAPRRAPLELVPDPAAKTEADDAEWLVTDPPATTDIRPPPNPNPGRPKRFSTSGPPSISSSER